MARRFALRDATVDDAGELAKLFLIASGGLAEYIWSQVDAPGRSLVDIGAERYACEGIEFSYENCIVAERGGIVVGMLHGFETPKSDGSVHEDPVLRPFAELVDAGRSDAASFYVCGIALFPDHRGQGIGTSLLEVAHERALSLSLPRVSLTCFEQNEDAMRLYKRFGYQEFARRPFVPHPMLHYEEGDVIFLEKHI